MDSLELEACWKLLRPRARRSARALASSDQPELETYWKLVRPRLKGGKSCRSRLVGKVFGRLTVVALAGTDKHKATLWRCVCTCGNEKVVSRGGLKSGLVKSCGCLLTEYRQAPKAHLNQPRGQESGSPTSTMRSATGGDLILNSGTGSRS